MEIHISDPEWTLLSRILSKRFFLPPHSRGRPRASDRSLFEGILWVLSSGSRWKDLPRGIYPAKSSCHKRFQEWCKDGSWERARRVIFFKLYKRRRIDLKEAFIDASFMKAKKGVPLWRIAARRDKVEKALV